MKKSNLYDLVNDFISHKTKENNMMLVSDVYVLIDQIINTYEEKK